MGIKVSLSSMATEVLAYARTRLLRWRMAGLWVLLLVGLVTAGPVPSVDSFAGQAAFLALATAVLRLWDDLADLSHDRREHPGRVLVASADLSAFVGLVAVGLLALALVLLDERQRLTTYGALLVALGLLYHSPLATALPRGLRGYLVLSKYPVLLFLAGAEPSGRGWLAALGLYAVLAVHEWRDDRALRAAPFQVALGSATAVALISLLFLTGGGPT